MALVELCQMEWGLHGVKFEEVMEQMDTCYNFMPTQYTSGVGLPSATTNVAGANNGSCKVYAFGMVRSWPPSLLTRATWVTLRARWVTLRAG
jgi:hypothetical protein